MWGTAPLLPFSTAPLHSCTLSTSWQTKAMQCLYEVRLGVGPNGCCMSSPGSVSFPDEMSPSRATGQLCEFFPGDAMGCSREQPSDPCPLCMPCLRCQDSRQPSMIPVRGARLCPARGKPPAPCSHLGRSALNSCYCFTFCSLLGHKDQSCQFARSDPRCPTDLTPSLKRQKSHCLAPPSV